MEIQFDEGDGKHETTSDFKEERSKRVGDRVERDCESTQGSSQNRILLTQPKEREVWGRKRVTHVRTPMRREMQVDSIPAI